MSLAWYALAENSPWWDEPEWLHAKYIRINPPHPVPSWEEGDMIPW